MSRLIPEEENKSKKKKSKKKRSKKSSGASQKRLFVSLVNGDFFTRDNIIANLPFLFYITFLLICYIGYGYYVDKTSRNIAELEDLSREYKAEKNNESAYYNQMSMYSRIMDSADVSGLQPSMEPPEKIKVSKEKFNVEE